MPRKISLENKKRFSNLRELGCIICSNPDVHIHHKTGAGMGRKSDDKETFQLCWRHHTGDEGIHTIGVKTWEDKYETQDFYIKQANKMLEIWEQVS